MSRAYEVVYIFDSTLEDAAITEKLTRHHALLGSGGAPPADLAVDTWGRRQLAYTIGPRDTGYYVVARFTAEPNVLPEFERALKLDEGVVRYLITLFEHEVGAPPMSDEDLVAARNRRGDDDDDDEE
jgi:small subunit ribosomal protein S6